VPLMCDSTSAISVAKHPVLHSKIKHIEVLYHFLRDNVEKGNIYLIHVPTQKHLPISWQNLWTKLPFLICEGNLVWFIRFELELGISCTYAFCMFQLCNMSYPTYLYDRLHLYHMLWRMYFSHIHWSLWYVGCEIIIMLVSCYDE
jgi:hypothetical protein